MASYSVFDNLKSIVKKKDLNTFQCNKRPSEIKNNFSASFKVFQNKSI